MSEQTQATTVVVPFEITGWDEQPHGGDREGPRVTLTHTL